MKTITLTLTAAAALSIAGAAAAENWNVVSRSAATVYMIDVDSIAQAEGATTARVARVPAAGPATDLSHTISDLSVRCSANQSKPGVEVVYGEDGAEAERIDDGYDFDGIRPNSLDAFVKQIVCDGDRGAQAFPTIKAFIEAGRPGAPR